MKTYKITWKYGEEGPFTEELTGYSDIISKITELIQDGATSVQMQFINEIYPDVYE